MQTFTITELQIIIIPYSISEYLNFFATIPNKTSAIQNKKPWSWIDIWCQFFSQLIIEGSKHENRKERRNWNLKLIGGSQIMIKSEQTIINGYGNSNQGANNIPNNISIPSGGGMAAMNNGAGDDGINIGRRLLLIRHWFYM